MNYIITFHDEEIPITPEVVYFMRSSQRKIRYFTYDLKRETIHIDGNTITIRPSREDSYHRLKEAGRQFAAEEKSVEDLVIEAILTERLRGALQQLNDGERRLIKEIYFSCNGDGKSEREAAESLGFTGG